MNDINEYSPVFKEKSYKATVIEGKKYDSILKVEAVDADCSFQFSQICNYEIVTPDVPFTIDKDGTDVHIAPLSLCAHWKKAAAHAQDSWVQWHASQCLLIRLNDDAAGPSFKIQHKLVGLQDDDGVL